MIDTGTTATVMLKSMESRPLVAGSSKISMAEEQSSRRVVIMANHLSSSLLISFLLSFPSHSFAKWKKEQ